MSTMSERLRDARKKAGFNSARSAALRFGWSPSTYAAHENGQNSFDAGQAIVYARAYKADPSWIHFGFGEQSETGGYVYTPFGFIYGSGIVSMKIKSLKNEKPAYILFTELPVDCKIFNVLDDTLWPQYSKTDLVVCRPCNLRGKAENNDFWFGIDAVVELGTGGTVFRQIEASNEKGVFNLVSQKLPPLRAARIRQAWIKVAVISRAGYTGVMEPVGTEDLERLEDGPFYQHE